MSSVVRRAATLALAATIVIGLAACAPDADEPPSTPSAHASTPTLPVPTESGSGASSATPTPTPTPTATSSRTPSSASIDDPASYSVVVNKTRPLDPKSYAAPDLVAVPVPHVYAPKMRKVAANAVVKMFAAFADQTGLAMQSQSAYRSYSAQVSTYNGWVKSKGKAAADLTSARPGYSEHQTGLAIDISAKPSKCALAACFADTPQGEWLAAKAWKYGFILRYPEGKTAITGYEFEPWHYRYVGVDVAKQYHDSGATTLEQFFGLPAAPDYLN